MTGHV